MTCQRCNSPRVPAIVAKCADRSRTTLDGQTWDGYAPADVGIGGGDYVRFAWCLACGQIQGTWPKPETELEEMEHE
jgi:hypothetical protein